MTELCEIIDAIIQRRGVLERAKSCAEKNIEASPEGKLRISHNQGTAQFYNVTEKNDTRGKYIQKKDMALIKALAQKDYSQKLISSINTEERILADIIQKMQPLLDEEEKNANKRKRYINPDMLYSSMNKDRQKLISPLLISNSEYACFWENTVYKNNEFKLEEKVYPTNRGEMVRSKSEVLLANMYYELGIPYRYEAELKLKNGP